MARPWVPGISPAPDALFRHGLPSTLAALHATPFVSGVPPDAHSLSIYTDGSAGCPERNEPPASSFIVLAHCSRQHTVLLGQHAWCLPASLLAICGSSRASLSAEAAALAAALLWRGALARLPATFYSDCAAVLGQANGECSLTDLGQLPELIRLIPLHSNRYHSRFEHVSAHAGNPWNEAADALCALASMGICSAPPPDQWLPAADAVDALHWALISRLPRQTRQQRPPLDPGGSLLLAPSGPPATPRCRGPQRSPLRP